jgi:hypothetical protein
MTEQWVEIFDFPNYSVSNWGRVRNEDRGRLLKQSVTKQGAVKVGLVLGGKQYTRSVKVLVAEAFIPEDNDKFDTPMHLDGNQLNNRSDNIVWRPRWFAWKYARQFDDIDKYIDRGPVFDNTTGEVYKNIAEAGITNGLLFYEIHFAIVNKTAVFPIWHVFDWVRD